MSPFVYGTEVDVTNTGFFGAGGPISEGSGGLVLQQGSGAEPLMGVWGT